MNNHFERLSSRNLHWAGAVALALCSTALSGHAEVVYDSTTHVSQDKAFNGFLTGQGGPYEFGDDVTLAGTSRLVNQFVFHYFGDIANNIVAMATVRFYANDAPIPGKTSLAPGTLLWQSDPFQVLQGGHIATMGTPDIEVGDTFTYSIEVTGLSGVKGNQFLLLTSTQVADIGKSFNDFWVKTPTGWGLNQLGNPPGSTRADFAVKVSAVPEPSAIALGALGAAVLGGMALRRNQRR